jgi:hypothetical protein
VQTLNRLWVDAACLCDALKALTRNTANMSATAWAAQVTSSCGGSGKALELLRISDNTPGAILYPAPPPWERLVSRG